MPLFFDFAWFSRGHTLKVSKLLSLYVFFELYFTSVWPRLAWKWKVQITQQQETFVTKEETQMWLLLPYKGIKKDLHNTE